MRKQHQLSMPTDKSVQILLLLSIVDTPEKDLPNVDWKPDMIKVRTSSVNSSSTLFSWWIHEMHNIVNSAQKQLFVLNSYLPGINKSILPKRHYDNIYSEKLVNILHDWIKITPV